MRSSFPAILLATLIVAPAHAQQVVEASTGSAHGRQVDHQCGFSQALLAAIEKRAADRKAETKARINALLDYALAGAKSRPQAAQSPVVVPPSRSGS